MSPSKHKKETNEHFKFSFARLLVETAQIGSYFEQYNWENCLDKSFSSFLQDCNLNIFIYHRDLHNPALYNFKQIEVEYYEPKEQQLWDVCFLTLQQVIPINAMKRAPSKCKSKFDYYRKTLLYFKSRKIQRFNQLLGFDTVGIYRMDDTWMHKKDFTKHLSEMFDTTLLNYSKKRKIQRAEVGEVDGRVVEKIQDGLVEFYDDFACSLQNSFGYVSYKNLQSYLN